MELISPEQRAELINQARDVWKLELRDSYQVDADDLAAWRSGDHEAVAESYREWQTEIVAWSAAGRRLRRVRIVSEPLSEYQQMALRFSGLAVGVGEDLRWLPRRLTSTVALPGNDFFVLDRRTAVFNVLDGMNDRAEIQLYTDADVVDLCCRSFESAWTLAIPHVEFSRARVAEGSS